MAAPVRNLFGTDTTGATNSATLLVEMSTYASGSQVKDRIYVICGCDGGGDQSVAAGAGWQRIATQADTTTVCNVAIFRYEVAVAGTVPDLEIDLHPSTSEMAVCHIIRVRPSSGMSIEELTPVTVGGSSTNPDPPSLTNNSGQTRDIYYIAGWGGDGNNVLSTAPPTNYGNHQSNGIGNSQGANVGTADRTRTAVASGGAEDPGTFTRATDQWAAFTLGLYEVVGAITGSLGSTLSPVTTSAASVLQLKATVGSTLAAASTTSAAALRLVGQVSQTLAPVTMVAAGEGSAGIVGTLGVTLAPATSGSSGALLLQGQVGTTLAAATSTAASALLLQAQLGTTLAPATGSGTAVLALEGTLGSTLVPATSVAEAALQLQAAVGVTLAPATLSAGSSAPPIHGGLTTTLSPASSEAAAQLAISGSVGSTLAAATALSSGVVPIVGSTLAPLGAATLVAGGTLELGGQLVNTLAPVTLSAHGGEPVAPSLDEDTLLSSGGSNDNYTLQSEVVPAEDTTLDAFGGDYVSIA